MTLPNVCLVILTTLLMSVRASADAVPIIHTEVIDADGQVSTTQWRSSSTWVWSQNHLLLQTAIEIPAHFVSTLPDSLSTLVRGTDFKGPFHLQDDHRFLILELHGPNEMFKLGRQSLRVVVEFDHTNWMRNSSCREANVSLEELESEESSNADSDALFISLYCRPARGGTWIEISASDEVSLNFEPHGQTRFKNGANGTELWLPANAHARSLADVIVVAASGEVAGQYELDAGSSPHALPPHEDAPPPAPLPVASSSAVEPVIAAARPLIGIDAQLIEAHGALQSGRTGRASTELAITARGQRAFDWGLLDADLELPLRRLGAGLDSRGSGSHLGWLNSGYELRSARVSYIVGAEASVLDVHSPDRSTVVSLSPSIEAHFTDLYSVTLAPFDFISSLSVIRARADWPLTSDRKNRLTFEALLGRTWIQPQKNSWNVDGASFGFVGEF